MEKWLKFMFEFHGWVTTRVDDSDDPTPSIQQQRLDDAEDLLRKQLDMVHDSLSVFELCRAGNGLRYLSVHGLRNHRYEPVIELFRWIADHLSEAYGLLYVWDDEDGLWSYSPRKEDYSNCFRVWRLVQGSLTEEADPFLSPCMPTIEKPWGESHENT